MGLTKKHKVLQESFLIDVVKGELVTVYIPYFLHVSHEGKRTWARLFSDDKCIHKMDFMHASTRKEAKAKAKEFAETYAYFD